MTYAIQDGPFTYSKRHKYPFAYLKVGQGFFVPCEPKDQRRLQVNLATRGRQYRDAGQGRFSTRVAMQNGETGVIVERKE